MKKFSLVHAILKPAMRANYCIKLLILSVLSCFALLEVADAFTGLPQANKTSYESYELAQDTSSYLARTQKQVYRPGEPIVVEFAGLPGNATDWITIVSPSVSDDTYNEWHYTEGRQSGYLTFEGLPVGEYEVRVYFNWSEGGYIVRDRYRFSVSN